MSKGTENWIALTDKVLFNVYPQITNGKTWLNHFHDSGTGKIDIALINGAKLDELEAHRGAVDQHLYHLRNEHGLIINENNGIYKLQGSEPAIRNNALQVEIENINNRSDLDGTEKAALTKVRIQQSQFRTDLLKYWENKCAVTGLSQPTLLIASHIRAWSDCDTKDERLDPFNGLLLSPNYDAVFDKHLITFDETGCINISKKLLPDDIKILGIDQNAQIKIHDNHQKYFWFHRAKFNAT